MVSRLAGCGESGVRGGDSGGLNGFPSEVARVDMGGRNGMAWHGMI